MIELSSSEQMLMPESTTVPGELGAGCGELVTVFPAPSVSTTSNVSPAWPPVPNVTARDTEAQFDCVMTVCPSKTCTPVTGLFWTAGSALTMPDNATP